jgi:hypothetical protein
MRILDQPAVAAALNFRPMNRAEVGSLLAGEDRAGRPS